MTGKRFTVLLFALSLFFSGLGVFVVNAVSDLGKEGGASNNIKFYKHSNGIAVGGYDVVAYFDVNRAVPGEKKFEANFAGMPWYFSSGENRDKFMANPLAYIPQYGGHCAYGVAQGYLVRGDPQAWSIINGVLYLNYSKRVRTAWLADVDNFIREGENSWVQLNNTHL